MKYFYDIHEKQQRLQKTILKRDSFEGISLNILSKENRIYIKLIYILYNVPISMFKNIMYPLYGDHGFEKATRKLIKEGWIYKERFGGENILAVTRKTLQRIYPSANNLAKTPIKESNIGLCKCKGLVAEYYIMQTYREFLIDIFKRLSKEEKKEYIKNQYIINIKYRSFIKLPKDEKELFISKWAIAFEEKETLLEEKRQNINQKAIKIFKNNYPFIQDKKYIEFLKLYKGKLQTKEATILLRDLKIKADKPFDLLQVIGNMKMNIIEVSFKEKFWDMFLSNYLNIETSQAEHLYSRNTKIKQMIEGYARRNLQQLNYEVQNNRFNEDTKQIQTLLKKKVYFEKRINWLNQQLDNIYKSKLIIGESLQGKKLQMTFNRLKQNGVYIKDFGIDHKGAYINWFIFDNVSDGLKGGLIAERTFLINSFMNLLFKLDAKVKYSVEIVTYSEGRKKLLQREIMKAIKRLQGFKGEFVELEIPIHMLIEEHQAKYELWQKIIAKL